MLAAHTSCLAVNSLLTATTVALSLAGLFAAAAAAASRAFSRGVVSCTAGWRVVAHSTRMDA
jgi:hypothetical protein